MGLKIIYRISDKGNQNGKPNFFDIKNCLNNFLKHFPINANDITLIADNVEDYTYTWLESLFKYEKIRRTNVGNAKGAIYALNLALEICNDDDFVYFVEDDYLHKKNSKVVLLEGLQKFDYVTLYDHLDKYMSPSPNPYVKSGGEKTTVYLTKSCHWKLTNSTTMTFATTVKYLKSDKLIFETFCQGSIPSDFKLFMELVTQRNRTLGSPLPGYSSHGATAYLTPLTNWLNEVL
jgi:hypothetical protein